MQSPDFKPISNTASFFATLQRTIATQASDATSQVCTFSVLSDNHAEDTVEKNPFFDEMQARFQQMVDSAPAKDLEKNMKAMLNQGFAKLDLVTREEFDIQMQALAKARARIDALEARVAELEARLNPTS